MNEPDDVTLGQVAFGAYRKHAEGRTHDGKPIPEWSNLGDEVQAHWEAAASAVVDDWESYR